MSTPVEKLMHAMLASESAFLAAAKRSTQVNWRGMFEQYAIQRREFAEQLKQFLPTYNADSVPLKGTPDPRFSSRDDQAILAELLETDSRTHTLYKEVMATGHLGAAAAVVREQATELEHTFRQIQSLSADLVNARK